MTIHTSLEMVRILGCSNLKCTSTGWPNQNSVHFTSAKPAQVQIYGFAPKVCNIGVKKIARTYKTKKKALQSNNSNLAYVSLIVGATIFNF